MARTAKDWNRQMRVKLIATNLGLLLCAFPFGKAAFPQAPNPAQSTQTEVSRQALTQRTNEDSQPRQSRSFVDSVMTDIRNRLGFSLGVYEIYDSNIFNNSSTQEPGTATLVSSRFYTNVANRRSRLHLDYGFGYRKYRQLDNLSASEQTGNVQFSRQVSRRVSLNLADAAALSNSDDGSVFSSGMGLGGMPIGFANDILLERQRIFRNTFTASVDYQLGRRVRLRGYGTHNLYRFDQRPEDNGQAALLGFGYDHRLNQWLDFSTSAATYIIRPSGNLLGNEATQIHRLQLVGFNTRLGRTWQIGAGGGIELAEMERRRNFGISYNGAIRRILSDSLVEIEYSRGFTSGIGWSRTFRSHTVSANVGQRFTTWFNAQASAIYNRSNEFQLAGLVENYSVRSWLEFFLRPELVASMGSIYNNQRTRDLALSYVRPISRYVVYISLQYVVPLVRR
jgi:hypothetical protein